jgi:hypothetical protein
MMRVFLAATALCLACATGAQAQQGTSPAPSGPTIVVPGERPGPAVPDDPRTTTERMRDVRAWDRCVLRAQRAADADALRPQMDSPEEICRARLGMQDRLAVPVSRMDDR